MSTQGVGKKPFYFHIVDTFRHLYSKFQPFAATMAADLGLNALHEFLTKSHDKLSHSFMKVALISSIFAVGGHLCLLSIMPQSSVKLVHVGWLQGPNMCNAKKIRFKVFSKIKLKAYLLFNFIKLSLCASIWSQITRNHQKIIND